MLITATHPCVAQKGTKPRKPVTKPTDSYKGMIRQPGQQLPPIIADTTRLTPANDATSSDTTKKAVVSGGFLDDKVNYKAEDSTLADLKNKKAYLYHHAEVYYQDMTLKAGYIEIDFEKKLVVARGLVDSTGKISERPVFEQGPEKFTAGQITYNFETKKGKIKDVITQQGEGYIHGNDIKKDTSNVYYVAEGKYTTCDLEDDPHYYFSAKKIKVIPNDKVVCGPTELFIADVPTPLMLPFGYFPNKKGRKSGIVIPGYGRSNRLGYFLSKGGFYYGGSDVFDALITADVYSNGGYSLYETTNYSKRYKYSGNVYVNYVHTYTNDANPELPNQPKRNDCQIRWTHMQNPKAHPGSTFSASVEYTTPTFGKNNGNVTREYIKTDYYSRLNYNKQFTGTPFNLTASGSFYQNIITRQTNITLPDLSLAMNRIYPFKNNSRIGKRWYDQIGIGGNLTANNSLSTIDTLLTKPGILRKLNSKAVIAVPIQTTITVLKYIQVTPTISTNGYLYFKTFHQRYDKDSNKVYTDTLDQVNFFADAQASTALSTLLYGDYFFKTKHLKQIHQVITPSATFVYKPDFSEQKFGYYGRYYDDSTKQEFRYPYFGKNNGPSMGKSESVNFSLSSTLEAKIKKNSDSGEVFKKVKLLESISASIGYNMAANTALGQYKWSDLILSGRTRLFDKVDVNAGAAFDVYHYVNNKKTPYLQIEHGYLASLSNFNAAVSTSLRAKEKKKAETPPPGTSPPPAFNDQSSVEEQLQYLINHGTTYVDFNVPWNLFLNYNFYYNPRNLTNKTNQTLGFSGDLALTPRWKINFNSGFDLKTLKVTNTSMTIHRDLHCWEMQLMWVPFGYRQTFLLTINVKSSMLRDLQLKKQNQENQAIGY